MTTREILTEARALIAKGWTQGQWARNERGRWVCPTDPLAVCWCITGAIRAVSGIGDGWPAEPAFQVMCNLAEIVEASPAVWNDAPGRTQEEVLALFDHAIAACGDP